LDLGEKARDLMPRICKGKVISGDDWGKLWTDHQNKFFQEKGLALRVDAPGVEPQEHLGPVRMRGRAFALIEENAHILEQNVIKAQNPSEVLNKLTERQSVFVEADVERFIHKHLPTESHTSFRDDFWKQKELIRLANKETGEPTNHFSSQKVVSEEAAILRLADRIHGRSALSIDLGQIIPLSKALNDEQKKALSSLVQGQKLFCLQGYAGTGKSHFLSVLQKCYAHSGYSVRAFGPDNATADVLKEKGFYDAENIYRFLYGFHNSKRSALKNKELWILDEAGKLGNRPLLEFLKAADKQGAQVVFSGDHAQLSSVERGGMFREFCERYGAASLQDIQRQKEEKQREVAKSLALGEIGGAIDQLTASSSIRWSATKNEAIESLVSKWALDTRTDQKITTLLIAHSNDEVRVLNEMVRILKKQRGELFEKEFACETTLGKVYLSVGDHIEFRKNDKTLGVTNGLSGVLVDASPEKFTVSLGKKGRKNQIVTFNPKEYSSYQLGYASTYFRSQGRTVDKAYVLHSPALNKRLFYVGLTRHASEAYYFVSKDQAYCLSDLKRQAVRDDVRGNTLSFTTQQELDLQKERTQKSQEIQDFKESASLVNKIRGYGLEVYELVKSKAGKIREAAQEGRPSEEFFRRTDPDSPRKAHVQEVAPEEVRNLKELVKPISLQEKITLGSKAVDERVSNVGHFNPRNDPRAVFNSARESNQQLWSAFGVEKKEIFEGYFSLVAHTLELRSLVDIGAEASSQGLASAPHFSAWQAACGKCNIAAHLLVQKVSPDELKAFLSKEPVDAILEQASRHQKLLDQMDKEKDSFIEDSLQDHIEPLMYRLFPDGPSRKDGREFRFGHKGSLAVVRNGDKAGQFYDFERQEGGSVLKLIQRELGLGRLEALEWAKDFIGIVPDLRAPKSFLRGANAESKRNDWVATVPDPAVPAPQLKDLGRNGLHHIFNEVARHPYRDENGVLLYYRLRLQDKADPTKKLTPPLSYGHWKSTPGNLVWELKGFDAGKAVLYNLPSLKQHPRSSVLVVEGEKTADKALHYFAGEDLICVTWPGGAGAVKRADWSPLIGRNVIVWPDNDLPGFLAGEDVCRELRRVGVRSLQMVDIASLKKGFPEKWDLADPLPSGVKADFPKRLLLSALEKGVDPQQILYRLPSYEKKPAGQARVNEVLWRVDERLRPALEKNGEPFWKVHDAIRAETSRILLRKEEVSTVFKGKVASYCGWVALMHEANHGRAPTTWEMELIQKTAEKYSIGQPSKMSRVSEFSVEQALNGAFEATLSGREMDKKDFQTQVVDFERVLVTQYERAQVVAKVPEVEKNIDIGPDIRR
jgi:Ti-type conjugative transfer relaxase TraA